MDKLSVLLIDDEAEFVNTLAERLELRGLHVRTAHDGQEGLLLLMEQSPDVVLVDMFMPGLSGADILHAVKHRYPLLPVIMLTGHAAPDTDSDYDTPMAGAYCCLTKPVPLQVLWDTLHAAVKAGQHPDNSHVYE